MIWAFWEIAKSLFVSVIGSRVGQLAIVALVSWFLGSHETAVKYQKIIAAEKAAVEAAYRAELQRQEYATREIAEAATRRAEDDADAAKDMQSVIDDYAKKLKEQSNVKVKVDRNCGIDSNFAGVVQQLSDADRRHSRAARRPAKLRKAR